MASPSTATPTSPSSAAPKLAQVKHAYAALEQYALDQLHASETTEDRATYAEILKSIAEARTASQTSRTQSTQFLVSVITPVLALLVTVFTVLFQYHQQQVETANKNEDAQWREALKTISSKDSGRPEMGALAMQGFFTSEHHKGSARSIASVLLADCSNVAAFDEVIGRMQDLTDKDNFSDLRDVAQMLGFEQRSRFGISGAASKQKTPFLIETVDKVETDPARIQHNVDQQVNIAGWELDSVSHALLETWQRQEEPLSPSGWNLAGIVLENAKDETRRAGNFDRLDFSGADLSYAILWNASFQSALFKKGNDGARTSLRNAYISQVDLRNADLSGADLSGANLGEKIQFENSRWQGTNWWEARCISPQLLAYLKNEAPHGLTANADASFGKCR